jgi:hypothetical protein
LIDSRNGNVLAAGKKMQKHGEKILDVDMMDHNGKPVEGYVRFFGGKHREIETRFTCDACSIAGALE